MARHESSVDFRNLIRDLAEIYPFSVDETVITELVANSLDANATLISIDYDPKQKKLVFLDNGDGMTVDQFRQYHNLAAGLKSRGSGIGFAGIGAKISFNIADRVITETKSCSFKGGSNWKLVKEKTGEEKLIWEDIEPTHIKGHGTRVEIDFFDNAEISFATTDEIAGILQKHYLPLFDEKFLEVYAELEKYQSIRFCVNGSILPVINLKKKFDIQKYKEIPLRRSEKLIGYGFIGLAKNDYPLGEDLCGVLISVYGKVIKSELFHQFPGREGAKIIGLFEVPALIGFLNTSKNDFIRSNANHKKFESYYGPIREAFKHWLSEAGIETQEIDIPKETRKIENEIKKILDDIPELSNFLGFRSRKDILTLNENGDRSSKEQEGIEPSFPMGNGKGGKKEALPDIGSEPGITNIEAEKGQKAKPISRSARRGPKIAFSNHPDKIYLAWVEGDTIFINAGHSVMHKLRNDNKNKMVMYLVAIGCAVQRYSTSEEREADLYLIDRIFNAWGKK